MHEGLGDRRMWDPHWSALADRFRVTRFDARGFGESADPTRPYGCHDDALEVMDEAGCDRAALMGVSFGGTVALDVALAAPKRVSALVLVNAAPSDWDTPEFGRLFDEIEKAERTRGIDGANEAEMRTWVDGPHRSPDRVDRELRAEIAAVNRVLLERHKRFEFAPSDPERSATVFLGELEPPTLVVTGELDQPSMLEACWAIVAAAGAEHADIAGTAHLPNLERPGEFLAAVLPFLEANAR